MAASSNHTKSRWNFYSTHFSPAKSATSSSSDEQATTRQSSECLSYARLRSVFPLGIVSEYDLKELRTRTENDKIFPGNLTSTTKWNSSPCLSSSSAARWGTKFVYTSPRSPGSKEGFDHVQPTVTRTPVRGYFCKRMYSCPTTPVNDFLRIEVPRLSSIMVQAQSVPLVRRRSQPLPTSKLKTTATSMGNPRRSFERAASLSSIERPKKTSTEEKSSGPREKTKDLSKSLSEIKIEDGVIIIDNGKTIDLRKDKARKLNQDNRRQRNSEASKSQSYREFQDAMQKFEDAQLNLEGEVNAKAKTSERREKEQQFLNENVQTQLLDLLTTVKGKRKNKGKKYKCF